jgi:polyferredoxin
VTMRRPLWIPWRWWRRAAQFVALAAFLWLFRRTEYSGADQLSGGENVFFRLDPLVASAAMLAGRQFLSAFWPAAIVAALTLVFGRFFCGWVCPLGTLLDGFHFALRPITRRTNAIVGGDSCRRLHVADRRRESPPTAESHNSRELTALGRSTATARGRAIRYILLIAVLLAAVFAFPLVGFVDPFALLVRGLAFWADPMLHRGVEAAFGWAGSGWTADVLHPFAKEHLLPFQAMTFHLAGVSAAILAAIFGLEFVARRFWCRFLCPAGAMFGLLSHRALLKRSPAVVCKSCGSCAATCRMGALDAAAGYSAEACNLCMDCVDGCPKGIVAFRFHWKRRGARGTEEVVAKTSLVRKVFSRRPPPSPSVASKRAPRPVDLSRRGLLVGIVAGVGMPGVASVVRLVRPTPVDPQLLRPPGAGDEKTFLSLCIRCGECMKVCPTNVLQPTAFQAGIEGMFSPRLEPRFILEKSNCEYDCTLCGQVCPTGAIPRLTVEAKHAHPTGKAYFDHSRCLPWAERKPCIVCEEMCPTPEKAIKILKTITIKDKDGEEMEIQQPYVDRDLCVGCGLCESKCPLPGVSGIRVQRVDAPDPGTEFRLKSGDVPVKQ